MTQLSKKIRAATVGLLVSAVIFAAGCSNTAVNQGGEVYYNAKIFTSDDDQPEASALVVKDGKISFVGSSDDALKFARAPRPTTWAAV